MRHIISISSIILILSGCANKEGVAPSQNQTLQAVSPSTTATAEGGVMQRSLDAWLKEEWLPLTKPSPSSVLPAPSSSSASVPAAQIPAASTQQVPAASEDNTPFTLQKYVDKWKVYQENKAKINEGKPKEESHIEQMQSLPVIGK